MKHILMTLAALALLPALAIGPSAEWTVPKVYTNKTGAVLNYRWMEPSAVAADKVYPLVVLLHGAGERGSDNLAQLTWGADPVLKYMREKGIEGYFVAGQVPRGKQWVDAPWGAAAHRMSPKPSETMALLFQLLDEIVAKLPVDRTRIYVTGVSMGGYGTWDAIQRRPDFFAAALPCCGGGDSHLAWKIRNVPIWTWHGDCDGAVPVCRSRDMVAALWAVDGKIRYTEVPKCGHGVWNQAYGCTEAIAWLFEQKNDRANR